MKNFLKRKSTIILIFIIIIIICACLVVFYNLEKQKNEKIIDEKGNTIEEIKVNSENNELDNNVYSIVNKNFNLFEIDNQRDENYQGIKLYEYDNTKADYAEIFYISYDYDTDDASTYNLIVTDDNENSLLYDEETNNFGEETISGGRVTSIKIKKTDLTSTIIFKAIERESSTEEIVRSALVRIDLSKDLELKEIIDQTDLQICETLGDVSFNHTEDENFYYGTTQHAYSTKLIGETISWAINSQYGNYLVKEQHIGIAMETNVNELSLQEAFEDLMLINNNLGQYGLSDIYGLDLMDKDGHYLDKTEIFTFEEILKVAEGEVLTKNGVNYTKSDFGFANMEFEKVCNITIGDGIQAIKYKEIHNEDDYYMFTYKNNIYYITCPTTERTKTVVEMFLKSLKIKT